MIMLRGGYRPDSDKTVNYMGLKFPVVDYGGTEIAEFQIGLLEGLSDELGGKPYDVVVADYFVRAIVIPPQNLSRIPNMVSSLTTLQGIGLIDNPIRDVRGLCLCKELMHVDLTGTNIESINPLRDLKKLEKLILKKTPLSRSPHLMYSDFSYFKKKGVKIELS